MKRNGRRLVRVKTLHGSFRFAVQRLGSGAQATTWLEQSGQVVSGYVSQRLAEFSAYYSDRLSYSAVAELLQRLSGEALLSDQMIQQLVVEKAVAVSQGWRQEVDAGARVLPPVVRQVDVYDAESEEILVLSDAIQVKQQKPKRDGKPRVPDPAARVRVNTDVWMVQQRADGFAVVLAGINVAGAEVVSAVERVKGELARCYRGLAALPIVAISDGARKIRCELEKLFAGAVTVILDWYHLEKKVWELLSMVCRQKAEKELHVSEVLRRLWRGQAAAASAYVAAEVNSRNEVKKQALVSYLDKHAAEIIDYERRQQAGKVIGSGRMEKGVDQVIGWWQKHKGMSWSVVGSQALGILKSCELNQQWQGLWFPPRLAV